MQACSIRDMHDDILASGFQVVGVSPQGESSHRRFSERHNLSFPLLIDSDKTLIRAFGVNGPMGFGVRRATFLIGTDGVIAQRHVSDFDVGSHTSFINSAIHE